MTAESWASHGDVDRTARTAERTTTPATPPPTASTGKAVSTCNDGSANCEGLLLTTAASEDGVAPCTWTFRDKRGLTSSLRFALRFKVASGTVSPGAPGQA